jgi:hypothetical protein
MTMAREYLPKLTIAILALSVALVLISAQPTHVAAAPAPASTPQGSVYVQGSYNSTDCTNYWWYYNSIYPYYYGYPNYYYYYSTYPYYYYGSPYNNYYYYWSYPYYYSSYPYSYCNYYYGYPYYGYYGYPYSNYYSPPSYTLTVATDPSNLGTVTGGGTYTQGSSASFSVTQNTIQVSPDTRYVFSHWTGDYSGVGQNGTVTVNGAKKITAVYQLQYYLTVNAQPANAPQPQGEGWYNANQTVTLQNAGQTIGGQAGSRLNFQGWSVDGQSPQTVSSLNVAMNAPHSVTTLYGQQYYLNVQSDQGVTNGTGWYDAGTTVPISVSTPVSPSYGVSMVFNGWQGDIQSPNQSTTVLMDGPKNIVGSWRTDSTVLYSTFGAIIVAAVLILAGIVIFATRRRRSRQAPVQQSTPTNEPPQPETKQPASDHIERSEPTA